MAVPVLGHQITHIRGIEFTIGINSFRLVGTRPFECLIQKIGRCITDTVTSPLAIAAIDQFVPIRIRIEQAKIVPQKMT